jgi:uncharacterized protein YdaL
MIRLFFLLLSFCCLSNGYAQSHPVLILYDAVAPTEEISYLHALFLANLLGHFEKQTTVLPIASYKKNQIEAYETTFYLGTHYNNILAPTFLDDVQKTQKNVIWFRYNLWQLINRSKHFAEHYGFNFQQIDDSGFDTIIYKKTALNKNLADPQLGQVAIHDASLAKVHAVAEQTRSGRQIPYITKSRNFWYVADIPFTYLSENDRYLAFADLLYDMLQEVPPKEQRRALLRLEDIHPDYDTAILRKTADYLYEQHIPFAIALIPVFADPFGYYNHGIPTWLSLEDRPEFVETLNYMQARGGKILLHGYTHQNTNAKNPYNGVSGDDYEFYKVRQNNPIDQFILDPLEEDSDDWIAERVLAAKTAVAHASLTTTNIWETPHYLASARDNHYFATQFLATIGRVHYFNEANLAYHAEQFYPYIIQHDDYGFKVIPENLGCISPSAQHPRTVDDLILTAQKNLVVRDAWASMYYHPYLGLSFLKKLIPAIKKLGYEFVPLSADLR